MPKNAAAFWGEACRLFRIVTGLTLYLSRPDRIPDPDLLRTLLERLLEKIGSSAFRDTRQVALRNDTMKEISAAFDKIFSYLESVATEEDFREFRLKGLETVNPGGRKRAGRSVISKIPAVEGAS